MIIDNLTIGQPNSRVFIIAELSANHNGSLKTAIETIKAAKRAGADCIKLQTYRPDTITLNSENDDFIIKDTIWSGKKLYDLYKEAFTPWEWHEELFKIAKNEGLVCFSSPFDISSVDFLESLNTPAYKIASFEITDIPLIEYVASKGKPVIISTGIASLDDINLAIETCLKQGNNNIALLKCTSSYPAPINEANLIMIEEYKKRFNVVPGLSDHTLGYTVPLVATALGAKIIEKHFILDREIGGPDSTFSMNELEFREMVDLIREAESSIGKISYDLTEKQLKGKKFARSLYIVEDIKIGQKFTTENLKSIRPGFGVHPKFYKEILGKKANSNIEKGSRFEFKYIEK